MALSPEQKKERAQKRAEYDAERERLYPFAVLMQFDEAHNNGCKITIDSDNPFYLEVARKGDWAESQGYDWQFFSLPLLNLKELGRFIHALVCRYNALVDESNAIAAQTELKHLEPMKADAL